MNAHQLQVAIGQRIWLCVEAAHGANQQAEIEACVAEATRSIAALCAANPEALKGEAAHAERHPAKR
jgi:hypothetical protein